MVFTKILRQYLGSDKVLKFIADIYYVIGRGQEEALPTLIVF
jgi:hypothetical protein